MNLSRSASNMSLMLRLLALALYHCSSFLYLGSSLSAMVVVVVVVTGRTGVIATCSPTSAVGDWPPSGVRCRFTANRRTEVVWLARPMGAEAKVPPPFETPPTVTVHAIWCTESDESGTRVSIMEGSGYVISSFVNNTHCVSINAENDTGLLSFTRGTF